MTTAECDEMIAVAEKTGRPLGVAYYRRGYPGIQRLKEELGKETIGEIHSAAINNEFPTSHRLDLVHWLFGEIEAVRTQPGSRSSHPFESTLDRFAVRTRSGVTVTMMTGWMETGMPEAIRVVGAKGVLALHYLKGGELNVMTEGGGNPWIVEVFPTPTGGCLPISTGTCSQTPPCYAMAPKAGSRP